MHNKIDKYLIYLWGCFIGGILFSLLLIFSIHANTFNLYGSMPNFEAIENPIIDNATKIYTSDNVLLGKFYRYNRIYVNYEDISPKILNTLLVTEDQYFYDHSGISLSGLIRAGISVVLHLKMGGGSTITQQLAKVLFQTRTSENYKGLLSNVPIVKMLIYKIKEWITAIKLERLYSKQEIITMYLNTCCFGNNSYGIEAAANNFFSCNQSDLTYEQAAILIAILKGPTYYSPIRHPERTKVRRDYVLERLFLNRLISEEEYENWIEKDIELSLSQDKENLAPYFKEYLKKILSEWSKKFGYDIYSDGLEIYTTIDSRVQKHAEESVAEKMKIIQKRFDDHLKGENPWVDEHGDEISDFIEQHIKETDIYHEIKNTYGIDNLEEYLYKPRKKKIFTWEGDIEVEISPYDEIKHNKRFLHTGLVAIDPYRGEVKAWVGGINFKHFKYDHIKQSKRQSGSAFKPIIYATAIENGMSPNDLVSDIPITFYNDGNVWTPKNASNIYTGKKYTLRQALSRSINSISAFLIKKLTPNLVVDYAHRLGIKSNLKPLPSLCLGSDDVSVFELTNVYCTFMNEGIKVEPICISEIRDKYGKVISRFKPIYEEAISKSTANKMVYMLRGAVEEERGTFTFLSKEIKEDNQLAGKTGTTSNQSDCWCVGMIKGLCTGVWVGADNRCIRFRSLKDGQGATVARPIWESFILKLYNDENLHYEKCDL